MKSLLRVLKNERYRNLLLFFILIFNAAVFVNVSAQYTPSAAACNFWCVEDPELNPNGPVSMNSGFVGVVMNQLSNGFITGSSYSMGVAACKESSEGCGDLESVSRVMDKMESKFSIVDVVADINGTILNERPISAAAYVNDKIYALTHPTTVLAQAATTGDIESREAYYSPGGTGFALLSPIQNFWSWSVRVVYGFLLIIVIIIAFAIMFRQRLSGNVEVTIQNAIPSIALAMILVPLSYAISGLFIDVITVGTNAVHEFLIGVPGSPGHQIYVTSGEDDNLYKDPLNPANVYPDRGYYPDDIRVDWLRARDNLDVAGSFGRAATGIGEVTGLNGNVIFLAIGKIVNVLTGKTDEDPANFTWIGDIVQFIVSIVTLWIGVQVFIALFKKYMTIILMPILSPFIFATVAIPGNGTKSVLQYCKVMLAASLFYIVTYAMFLLSIIFTSSEFIADVPTIASGSFNPPLIGLKSIGFGSNEITQLFLTLVGLGIYFSIPATLKSIDTALDANQPLPKFVTTPIESFNESRKVMFKTLPTAGIGAVASGVRGIRSGAKGIRNIRTGVTDARQLPSRMRAKAVQATFGYQNWRKGVRAGERGSAEYQQAQDISRKISELEAQRQAAITAGEGGKARRLAGEIDALKQVAKDLGPQVEGKLSSAIKPEEEQRLNAVFKGNSSNDNEIVFKTADIDALVARPGGLAIAGGGKIVLEAAGQGNVLPSDTVVEIHEAIQDPATGKFEAGLLYARLSQADPTASSKGDKPLGIIVDASKASLDTIAQLVCTAKDFNYRSQDGKKIEIPFDLKLDAVTLLPPKGPLFGTKALPTATTYTGGWIDTVSPANTTTLPGSGGINRFIFVIGDQQSGPVKINIKYIS